MSETVPLKKSKSHSAEGYDIDQPQAKRQKIEDSDNGGPQQVDDENKPTTSVEGRSSEEETSNTFGTETLLPPSRSLLGAPRETRALAEGHTHEFDVGISEYISKDLPPIHAIIKQRFTDFIVHEVNLDGQEVRIQSLELPQSESKDAEPGVESTKAGAEVSNEPSIPVQTTDDSTDIPQNNQQQGEPEGPQTDQDENTDPWPEKFTTALTPFLSESLIEQLKNMYIEGPEPPFVSDSGWGSRQNQNEESTNDFVPDEEKISEDPKPEPKNDDKKRGRESGQRRNRGRRSIRNQREDKRRVISEPMMSKTARTGLHKVIRELFGGKLDSETDTSNPLEEGRVVIKWARAGQGRGAGRRDRGDKSDKPSRGNYPPYIHFTMQKTNRDTQDALGYLSRVLHCSVKDLSVAGTKDKRGVTVQRVALRRGNKTVEDVFKMANGLHGRRTLEEVQTQRGERGVRIADFKYGRAGLELGMLKGNTFLITLRNVRVEPVDVLDKAMTSLKEKGFINYYGMQRFGTASIPTHIIGLAFLQCDWKRAASLILRHRPGEHPDVVAARDAWLKEKDLDKALELFPRRVVAERCILESFKKMKGDTRNVMGALSTIPRNLRLMYVHAYQSYVWNAIVSERIRRYGPDKPVVGDLVYECQGGRLRVDKSNEDLQDLDSEDLPVGDPDQPSRKSKRPWVAPKVKTLTAEDVERYTIFDVIMPLPGKDVAYPEGELGELYREFLRRDGLDPDNFSSKHKDYNLCGSYRKMLLKPQELSWSVLRYTDPDVSLAQADEDVLLGKEPPVIDEDGKFVALQVKMQLNTAAYATMALREVTKTETSSHYQTSLTFASEDQAYRGTKDSEEMET